MSEEYFIPNPDNYDPCGQITPGGCAQCPHSTGCFPDQADTALDIVDATVTFRFPDGDTDEMPLEEFLNMAGFLDLMDDDSDCIDFDELIAAMTHFQVLPPYNVVNPDGNLVQVDRIGGMWHVGEAEDLDQLRHLETLMTEERWGEEYFEWD